MTSTRQPKSIDRTAFAGKPASTITHAGSLRHLLMRMRRRWQLYVLLILPLAYIIIFSYVPILGAQIAFRDYTASGGIWGSTWVGMANNFDESNAYFHAGGSFEYDKLYNMIHSLQPDAVVLNNRHEQPLPGEDAQGFEQDLPGFNTAGFNPTTVYDLPLEVCMTINDHWGYSAADRNPKTSRHLVHLLVRSASVGANYLLNVGPTALGEIVPLHAERLRGVGQWLKSNGDSVYGTRAGAIPATPVAVSTRKGDTHYVHVLDYNSDCVTLTGVPDTLRRATLLKDGAAVDIERNGEKCLLYVPEARRDSINTVVVLV